MSILGFCDLTVKYADVPAVVQFNDVVRAGEWLCLIGPNGAGKSTVLRAAAGLVGYEGSVAIDQLEIPATSARWRARHIAFVPQAPIIPPDMSVYDYVLLGRNPYIKQFARETAYDCAVVERVTNQLDLTSFAKKNAGNTFWRRVAASHHLARPCSRSTRSVAR